MIEKSPSLRRLTQFLLIGDQKNREGGRKSSPPRENRVKVKKAQKRKWNKKVYEKAQRKPTEAWVRKIFVILR